MRTLNAASCRGEGEGDEEPKQRDCPSVTRDSARRGSAGAISPASPPRISAHVALALALLERRKVVGEIRKIAHGHFLCMRLPIPGNLIFPMGRHHVSAS